MLNGIQFKSETAMIKVQERALEKGIVCCKPLAEGTRYDLILDDGSGKLLKAQVKYCDRRTSNTDTAVGVSLKSSAGQGAGRSYTANEIDVLLVYVKAIEKVCCIPVGLIDGKSSVALRLEAPKNGQHSGVKMAKDFVW